MQASSESTEGLAVHFAALLLVLIAPLLHLLVSFGYPLLSPEVGALLLVAVIVAISFAGLMSFRSQLLRCALYSVFAVLFVDLEFDLLEHWGRGVGASAAVGLPLLSIVFALSWLLRAHLGMLFVWIFAAINAVTLLTPATLALSALFAEAGEERETAGLPIFVHLVLDEHIGIEGIPADIPGGAEARDAILSFLGEHGFQTFGAAYSKYFYSKDSLSTLVNFDSSAAPQTLYLSRGGGRYALKSNAYFRKMRSDGYRLRVYQSTYLDFCQEGVMAGDCFTYSYYSISRSGLDSLGAIERFTLLAHMYARLSLIAGAVDRVWKRLTKDGELATLPRWDGRVSPISTMAVIDRLTEDIESGHRGRFYFAHLLLPHFPYIYDRECRIRTPIVSWLSRQSQSPDARALRYSLYFDQIHCTLARLRGLFEGMKRAGVFDDATIVVHGDHGSRLFLSEPKEEFRSKLTQTDLVDGFSTLFAVKLPGRPPGYDTEMRAIDDIFEQLVEGSPFPERSPGPHEVYLKNGSGWSAADLPTIGKSAE